jgi:hypothetical protein
MYDFVADYRKLLQIILTLGAALLVLAATRFQAQAEPLSTNMIVIPASDGYGFDDCLQSGKACGKVIADAWCEAHGYSTAMSYGKAEDVTAAIPNGKPQPKFEAGSFLVNCKG